MALKGLIFTANYIELIVSLRNTPHMKQITLFVGAKRLKTRGQMLANSFDIIILETAEQMVKVHTHQILGVAQVKVSNVMKP